MEPSSNTTDIVLENAKENNTKGWKIATAVTAIIAVCGVGFGIYGLITMLNVSSDSLQTVAPNELSAYETRDLVGKTLRLLGDRNGLSSTDYYDAANGDFMIYNSYMPTTQLFSNDLNDELKTYITLETTTKDKENYCPYSNDAVRADIDVLRGMMPYPVSFNNTQKFDCVSYAEAYADYMDLWGENLPIIEYNSENPYNGFIYGTNSKAYYYHIAGGRGGACANYILGKINNVSSDADFVYVDLNAGEYNVCAGGAGELYSDIEKTTIYKTFDYADTVWSKPELASGDYNAFQGYRFVFKKNPEDIYSFSRIEKM